MSHMDEREFKDIVETLPAAAQKTLYDFTVWMKEVQESKVLDFPVKNKEPPGGGSTLD